MRCLTGIAILAGCLLVTGAFAQTKGGGTGGTGGTGSGTGGPGSGAGSIASKNTPLPGTNTSTPDPIFQQRGVFLAGRVMLSDGSLPHEPIPIERVCGGSVRREGYTDTKGRFSFQVGANNDFYSDASTSRADIFSRAPTGSLSAGSLSSGTGIANLMGCEIRASLPGYRSDQVNLAGRRYLDNPDIGTIVLHRLTANGEGLTISATSALAPKEARKAFEKGLELNKSGKQENAEREFRRAVDAYPKYSAAWLELGVRAEERGNLAAAREAYLKAIEADAKYLPPLDRLSVISIREQQWEEAAGYTERILRLNLLDYPQAFYYNAVANLQLKRLDAAEKSIREAMRIDVKHLNPKAYFVLGHIQYEKHDFIGAVSSLKEYLTLVPDAKDSDIVKQQIADLEKVAEVRNN